MKVKTTRKQLAETFDCIAVGYSEIPNLLQWEHANFYTCGVYGWNFDAYLFQLKSGREVCVTTGYRGMIDNCKNNCSFELYRRYDDKAKKIVYDYESSLSFEQKKAKNRKLLNEFLEECFKED